jgi:copper chaperone NosL
MNLVQLRISGIILGMTLFAAACSVKQKPIEYGEVACHYCSMTIVDKQHAAQLVTSKGKVYNYDAIECMLNHMKDENSPSGELLLVNDYKNPGKLVDATKATYLISEGIPSPMGEYLTGFYSSKDAEESHRVHGGELYDWLELKEHFKNRTSIFSK